MNKQVEILEKLIVINDKRIDNTMNAISILTDLWKASKEENQRQKERIESLEYVVSGLLKARSNTTESRN